MKIVLKSRNKPEDVKFFLERGANVRYFKDGEESPLFQAIQSIFLKEGDVRILVEYGADLHQRNKRGVNGASIDIGKVIFIKRIQKSKAISNNI